MTGKGIEVITYDRYGKRKNVLQFDNLNEAVKFWNEWSENDVLPTIWKNGNRLEGF